jgi:hypothetical protein
MDVISQTVANFLGEGVTWMVRLLLAVLVLLVGLLAAKIFGKLAAQIVLTASVDDRLGRLLGLEAAESRDKTRRQVALVFEKVVTYLLIVVALIFALEVIGDRTLSMVLQNVLSEMSLAIPRILKAMLILAGAWILALLAKLAVIRVLRKVDLDRRLTSLAQAGEPEPEAEEPGPGSPEALGAFVFYFILLFALLPFLDALGLPALVEPLKVMFDKAFGYLPQLFTAALVLVAGIFLARLAGRLVESFARASNLHRLAEGLRAGAVLESLDLPRFLGTLVFVAVLIPVLATVFDILGLPVLSGAFGVMLNEVAGAVPRIFGAFLLMALGLVLGRYLGDVGARLLKEAGFDALLGRLGFEGAAGKEEEKEGALTLSGVAGNLIMAVVVLFFLMEGFRMVRFDLMADAVDRLILFLPSVLVAFVILGLGFYLGRVLESLVSRSFASEPTVEAGLVGLVLRYAVIVFAFFMAFDQLGIAHSIVTSAFTILLGTVGLGLALAFGLGSKDHARDFVQHLKDRRAALLEKKARAEKEAGTGEK